MSVVRKILATIFLLSPMAVQAHLVVVGGELQGATAVEIDGQLYDVSFVDGTCADLFSGCDSSTDFFFQTRSQAEAASRALLAQVFRDVAEGAFDSAPNLTRGIENEVYGLALTPYGINTERNLVAGAFARNDVAEGGDYVRACLCIYPNVDTTTRTNWRVWANWTVHHPVPEPATLGLLSLGLVSFGFTRRKRREG